MARIKKYADNLTQPLTIYQTFVLDSNPNSQYFRITEFKEAFTGGKNGFLIEGSEHLKESTDIKIEILDVDGNPIYFEPGNGVPEYYEGLSKVVAVYIYEDTPIGNAKITILGELKTYVDADGIVQPIPDEWAGIYNVKWEKDFKVNRLLANEDKVRFYKRPQVTITEIVKPIFSNVVAPKIQKGNLIGTALIPNLGASLKNVTSPTAYLLTTTDNTFWTASVVGTNLNFDGGGYYNPLVESIVNSRQLIVGNPYVDDTSGLVSTLGPIGYTASFNYTEGVDNLKTALTGSFAKISISDLTTFVGDAARVKIFRKSTTDLSDFQFVQEIQLESNELLVDLASTTKNQENYGLFDNSNFKEYWVTSSNNLTASFNQTFLFDSVKLNSTVGTQKFFTTKSFNITQGNEYTLNFNVRKQAIGNSDNYIQAYLSGSRQTTINGVPTTLQVTQSIVTLKTENALLQKQNISENIKAEEINNAKLYFDVKGNDWHVSEVSLKASQETAFSPDEITFIQSVPRILPIETFIYRFEFYDINNNYVPVLVEETKTFDGGNLQELRKGLVFSPRSLSFQFDSGSQPVAPTVVGFTVTKNLLTGSVTYTSQSFDFFGNELFGSDYTASFTGRRYPGLLSDITSDTPTMTVGNFTGSRGDKLVQLIKITGEVEGFTDTVIFTKVLDGFGGVNYLIRPYRGTQIRNSSTASLEIQAVRIDGVNDIELSSTTKPEKGWPDTQLHIISRSADGAEKFVNLQYALSSSYIYGLNSGSLGSGEINYNAVFNRDSIDFRRTVYLISSQSAASGPAYLTSASVVASQILEDLQDGLDSGVVIFNADSFTINPRTESTFKPAFGFATASFAKRGTAASDIEAATSSFQVYPSMSINKDWVPEYWMYYATQSCNPTITVVAKDDNKNIIPSQVVSGNVRSPLNQTKNLTLTFTYTEPWTSASVSIDKTFTIVPEGKQGDESIVFEVNPMAITLGANSRGIVTDYKPSITDIRLKQGARYLAFSSSAHTLDNLNTHGTFYIATASIIEKEIKAGNVHFTSSFGTQYTASLIVSQSYNFTQLSGSIEYPLIIHPYFTSSIYTASVVVNYTKILEGPPPIQIVISPTSVALTADEVGFVTPVGYSAANTTIQVKEGDDFLKLITTESFANADARKGTYTINSIETRGGSIWNIRTGSLASSSLSGLTGTMTYNRFDYPYVSASALYTIQVYPYALGAGHLPTSSIFTRTQTFTKNVTPPKARSIDFKASTYTINYDRNGRVSAASQGGSELSATAFNTTSSADKVHFYLFDNDGSEVENIVGNGSPASVVFSTPVNFNDIAPDEIKKFTVRITDGNPYVSPTLNPYRAEAQLTISGVKAGADSYKLVASNESTSITADLWGPYVFSNTGMKITTFNGTQQLINQHPLPQANLTDSNLDYNGDPIGALGYSSASIVYKDNWITSPTILTGNPAEVANITSWQAPAVNTSGKIVYRIDFEGDSSTTDPLVRPLARQTQFVTQSIAVQFTPPPPYDVKMENENASAVYRVSGEFDLGSTGNKIRVYRGATELVNTSTLPATDTDAYGTTGLSKDKCRVSISSVSPEGVVTLAGIVAPYPGKFVSGTPATFAGISGWTDPENNPLVNIIYQIECEGRETFFKTQSLSVQFEGNVGPGIVMRGEWSPLTDYIGSHQTSNSRRDAVIYSPVPGTTKYYGAISGSGPNTYNNPTIVPGQNGYYTGASPAAGYNLINYQAPTPNGTNVYWEYLGEEEFFVAAKIAIFEESYVKNTINIGTKDGTSGFANIVLAGGRPDPYMAIGQNATVGTAGTSGTTNTTGVIGYNKPGIFLGIYENGTAGTTGRFSIKTTGTSGKGMSWDGDTLTIIGSIRQVEPGVSEGSLRGAWTTGFTYYTNDIVSYAGQSWRCTSALAQNYQHVATNDTAALTGYPGSGPWAIAAAAGTSGTAGTAGSGGANGAAGAAGPGVVYRGPWADGTQYFKTADRTDIVRGSDNQYYIAKSTHTPSGTSTRPIDGGSYSTYWQSFGATFSSVATNLLLAQDATVTRGLVLGTADSFSGFLRSANATTLQSGTGFFLDVNGNFRFGESVADGNNYVYWNGTQLDISGRITATEGNIGGFTIANNVLAASGSLLQIDTQVPQISFFRKGDLSSAKVILNPSQYLSNPAADPLYGDSGADWTGTTSVSAAAGTTAGVDTYITVDGISVKGNTTDGAGTSTALAAGTLDVTVYLPTTALTQTAGTISTTSAYPPDDPSYPYETYASSYAGARTSTANWYLQLYNAAGTTLITEQQLASTYRSGPSSYTYYSAYSYTGYAPFSWTGPSTVNSAGYYQGDIAAGTRTTTINVPSSAIYKVALCLRVATSAGAIYDYTTYTNTYYANTGVASHSSTGALTTYSDIRFKTNVNKTEISGGGVQVVTNESSYVRMLRVVPGSYSYSSLLFTINGGRADFTAGGATLAGVWTSDALWIWGAQYNVGQLRIGGGGSTLSATAYEILKVEGPYTATLANQFYATYYANILPYADDTWDLGKASSGRWRDIFTNGAVTTTSDRTKKANIIPSILGLDFINKLTPVSYTMITGSKVWEELPSTISVLDEEEEYDNGYLIKPAKYKEIPNPQVPEIIEILPGKRTHYGLIAQDVKIVLDEMGLSTTDFAGYMAADPIEHTDLGLRYEEFISPIVKAIQELSSKVDRLEAEISSSKI